MAAAAAPGLPYLPAQIIAADFNGDGKIDLLISCQSDGALTLLFGQGDGTFALSGTSPSTGVDPNAVAVGDFNGDGKLDIAVTTGGAFGSDELTILLGNGDGTFASRSSSLPVGIDAQTITVGDLNGNGTADLAVANWGSDTLTVLLGNGDGTFTPTADSPATGYSPYAAIAADFDGDGVADLAAVNNAGNNVTVLLSRPTETSTAALGGVSPIGTGVHLINASYPGDSGNAASVSNTVSLTALLGTPAVRITPSSTTIGTAQRLSLAIVVSDGSANPAPTGTVTVTSGKYASAATTLLNGAVTVAVPAGSIADGTDTLKVAYSGDFEYAASAGTAMVTVSASTFTVSGTAVAVAVGATNGNTSTVTVAPTGGFTGSVVLFAAITSSPAGAQNPPTLSFGSTSPVNIAGSNSGTAILTVTTASATTASSFKRPVASSYSAGGALLGFILLWVPGKRRLRVVLGALLGLCVLAGGAIGCGGGSGGNLHPGSTPGAYTITVTGASGSLSVNSTISLTVN
jgi:hypothetical protein